MILDMILKNANEIIYSKYNLIGLTSFSREKKGMLFLWNEWRMRSRLIYPVYWILLHMREAGFLYWINANGIYILNKYRNQIAAEQNHGNIDRKREQTHKYIYIYVCVCVCVCVRVRARVLRKWRKSLRNLFLPFLTCEQVEKRSIVWILAGSQTSFFNGAAIWGLRGGPLKNEFCAKFQALWC